MFGLDKFKIDLSIRKALHKRMESLFNYSKKAPINNKPCFVPKYSNGSRLVRLGSNHLSTQDNPASLHPFNSFRRVPLP